MTAPAGWYDDPNQHGFKRWFDGERWTEHIQPVVTIPPAPPPPSRGQAVERRPLVNEALQQNTAQVVTVEPVLQSERERWLAFAGKEYEEMCQRFNAEKQSLEAQLGELRGQLYETQSAVNLQEVGLVFDGEHPTQTSVEFGAAVKQAQDTRKAMVKNKQAVTAATNWTVGDSATKGQKMVDDLSKLMLRAYNSEVDALVKSTSASNASAKAAQLGKKRDQIKKLGAMLSIEIHFQYHDLAVYEINTTGLWKAALAREKEQEKAHKEQLREEKKAREEIAREEAKLQKELDQYAQALVALESEPSSSPEEIERLRSKVQEVEAARDDVTRRAANTRAGHVYVISNPGSMGDGVVKIGMTRRLDPMDRVNELGDASVPFRFSVHALIFSDDAVALEAALHQRFAQSRINRVNMRREFFRVSPEAVREALVEFDAHLVEWTEEPSNEEWEASR